MVKLIGAALVVFSCSLLGFQRILRRRTSLAAMEEIKNVLILLKQQISFNPEPLPELLMQLKHMHGAKEDSFLFILCRELEASEERSVRHAWALALEEFAQQKGLSSEARRLVSDVGQTLGSMDRETECERLCRGAETLGALIQKEESSLGDSEKTIKSLGVLSGICIVIVLI